MKEYAYTLEPYAGRRTRHTCPQCGHPKVFSRYVHTKTREALAVEVGRCDREANCGYHYPPGQYLRDQGLELPSRSFRERPVSSLPQLKEAEPFSEIGWGLVNPTLKDYAINTFYIGLAQRFGHEIALELMLKFYIGTMPNGDAIFWQIDERGRVRTGKIIGYDPLTLKRLKQDANGRTLVPGWAHVKKLSGAPDKESGAPDFTLRQALFGQHQLENSTKPIGIVEAEKTAVVCAHLWSRYTWLATGGSGAPQFTDAETLRLLHGREVTLFPDTGATDKWKAKAQLMRQHGVQVRVFTDLEGQRPPNWDLADEFLAIGNDLVQTFRADP